MLINIGTEWNVSGSFHSSDEIAVMTGFSLCVHMGVCMCIHKTSGLRCYLQSSGKCRCTCKRYFFLLGLTFRTVVQITFTGLLDPSVL